MDGFLLITVAEGWTKSELFLKDLKKDTPPTRITTGKNFLYSASVYNGRIYIVTNEDAPRYRVFVAEVGNYERDDWQEIIPQTGSVLQGVGVWGGKTVCAVRANATSQLKIFNIDGTMIKELTLPALVHGVWIPRGNGIATRSFMGFWSFTVPPTVYRYDLKSRRDVAVGRRWMRLRSIPRL